MICRILSHTENIITFLSLWGDVGFGFSVMISVSINTYQLSFRQQFLTFLTPEGAYLKCVESQHF